MSFYVYETQVGESARTCTSCGDGMDEGYLHEPTGCTYCCVACLDNDISAAEQLDMTTDNLFWTDWHDEVAE